MIHYEDKKKNIHRLISLNKSCKYCTKCDLIIGQKSDLDALISQIIPQLGLKFSPDNYFVFGTQARKDWKKGQEEYVDQKDALTLAHPFKDILQFEIRPAGWYFDGE